MGSELCIFLFAVVSAVADDPLVPHWHVNVLWKHDCFITLQLKPGPSSCLCFPPAHSAEGCWGFPWGCSGAHRPPPELRAPFWAMF